MKEEERTPNLSPKDIESIYVRLKSVCAEAVHAQMRRRRRGRRGSAAACSWLFWGSLKPSH